ncbi:uncharacterized protein LOC131890427 isoform X1 [Tigriopus californicus]|uniref:uncharacterized protein LOC131890427 isoform X1 n=1 Tax=Tigriopus californicus TaxID=6832 RepID=UPI0027D9E40E|nr:uncharacterized protein LOC131890427 isoform X1 [Tigriopus californicus]
MNPTLSTLLVGVVIFLAICQAVPAEFQKSYETFDPNAEEDEEAEARTLITSNGQYFLVLNSTFVILYTLLFLLGILVSFFATSILGGLLQGGEDSNSSGYNNYNSGYSHSHSYRKKRSGMRFDMDLASQMFQLAEAFKKYEVKDRDCQTYVACEASQVQRHEENGILAKVVYDVMKKLSKHGVKQIEKKDKYLADLVRLFQYGDEAHRLGKDDACGKQRDKCYNATKKPEYKK